MLVRISMATMDQLRRMVALLRARPRVSRRLLPAVSVAELPGLCGVLHGVNDDV